VRALRYWPARFIEERYERLADAELRKYLLRVEGGIGLKVSAAA
jgi:hypothetical protein